MGKDYQDTSELEVRQASASADRIDARKALETVINMLANGNAYYVWTPIGEQGTFMMRVPREERMNEAWLKDELPQLIHVCQPIQLLKAFHAGEKNKLPNFCGYVRDDTCTRCKREVEVGITRRAEAVMRLAKLNKNLNG